MRIFYSFLILFIISFTSQAQENRPEQNPARQIPLARIIKFYPNPAVSVINFDFQKGYDKSYTFLIFNGLGKKVYEETNVSPKTSINLGNYYRGVYIFQLRDRSGKLIDSGKFQVIK